MVRQPAVANRFYPGSPKSLQQVVADLLPTGAGAAKQALAVVAPHAGYIYSGRLAAAAVAAAVVPETVVILGPNHHGRGAPVAVSTSSWQMPTGLVPCDTALAEALTTASSTLQADEEAHRYEHSLEVQVPFLQALQPRLSLVGIALSQVSLQTCLQIATELAAAIRNHQGPVLMVASTDMSHYESRQAAQKKDWRALDRMLAFDPEGLYHTVMSERISMCGVIPVTIVLAASRLLGGTKVELIEYTDSGYVSGDTQQVVGYAGLIIT